MDLWVGLDRSRWVQCTITYLFAASLGTSSLIYLIAVVFEAEEVGHVVGRYLFLTGTADGVLMHHRLTLVKVATHLHTLDVDWLGHAVCLVVKVRVISHVVGSLDIDLEHLLSFSGRQCLHTHCRFVRTLRVVGLHLIHLIDRWLAGSAHALRLRL